MAVQLRVLKEADVRRLLSPALCLSVNERAFADAAAGLANVPERLVLQHARHGPSLFKPAALGDDRLGVKVVSVRPGNAARGLPTVPAVVLLLDAETAMPTALVEGTWLTALRTAAGSALATRLFSAADDGVGGLTVFGAGMQAHAHILMHMLVRPSTPFVAVVNRSAATTERLRAALAADALTRDLPVRAVPLGDDEAINRALAESDTVCLCTNASSPVLTAAHRLRERAHINAVGAYTPAMQEMDSSHVAASFVVLDTRGALACGDLARPVGDGCVQAAVMAATPLLGAFLDGAAMASAEAARRRRSRTLFKSVGTAFQDVASATAVLRAYEEELLLVEAAAAAARQ